jgi:hypothetical protein
MVSISTLQPSQRPNRPKVPKDFDLETLHGIMSSSVTVKKIKPEVK